MMSGTDLDLITWGGTVGDWLVALAIAALIFLGVALLKPLLQRRLGAVARRTQTPLDDVLVALIGATHLLAVALVALWAGSQFLELSAKAGRILLRAASLAVFLQVGLWGAALLDWWLRRTRERALATDVAAATSLAALGFVGRVLLWVLVALLALDNLGINITALIAGLGIGGVAIALAVQSILGDLFASLSIVIDKPFVIGDFIVVDTYMGTVENVGLKTTRIRSLDGEQIVFSNGDLLKTRLRNYKRMYERRAPFSFGLRYETTPEQLEQVPSIVKRLVEGHRQARFERAHFRGFGVSSLDFEVVYWITSPDYNVFMDIQQAINLALMRELAQRKIDFAFPSRTVYLERPPSAAA